METNVTQQAFEKQLSICRELFINKMHDYGLSWRILRPTSLTDQIYIKANRIRTIEEIGECLINEGVVSEYIGIVNYCIMALIQLSKGYSDNIDLDPKEAIELYDTYAAQTKDLMLRKNHDYGEAWRLMRITSYTDLILMKVFRTKQIEANKDQTLVSEGRDANYQDIMNYAIFALIKLNAE